MDKITRKGEQQVDFPNLPDVIQSQRGVWFKCLACGLCCSGESEGLVFIYKEEIQRICSYLKLSEADFLQLYCDVVDAAYKDGFLPTIVLQMNPTTQNCIFQEANNTCRIYPVRPFQCASFPFWALNVRNTEAWNKVKDTCRGFETKGEGHLYSLNEIKTFLDKEKALEDEHYKRLLEHDFKLSAIYPCLEQKETANNVTKSLDRHHPGTVSNHTKAGTTRNSPNTGRD